MLKCIHYLLAIPQKSAGSVQFFIVVLTKVAGLVRSFSDLCPYLCVYAKLIKSFKLASANIVILDQTIYFRELFVTKSYN